MTSSGGNYGVHVAVATDGEIGGFVATGPSRDEDADASTGELVAIYLRPQLWGIGVGSRLHQAGTAALAARFNVATLWVLDSNELAHAFYERHGWRPDGTTKTAALSGSTEIVELRYRRLLPG